MADRGNDDKHSNLCRDSSGVTAALLARHSGWVWVLTIIGLGSVLVIISAYISLRIGKTYGKRLKQAYKLVKDAGKT